MDITPAALFVSLLASSIGLAMFIYGKKQSRAPQLVAGVALMALPVVVHDPLWMAAGSGLIVLSAAVVIRLGH